MYIHVRYNIKTKYEWDERKNIANYYKHEIWFEEAQSVWVDLHSIEFYNEEHSDQEERFIRIGRSLNSRLLLVVFCERLEGRVIRIISARKATRRERLQYEEGI